MAEQGVINKAGVAVAGIPSFQSPPQADPDQSQQQGQAAQTDAAPATEPANQDAQAQPAPLTDDQLKGLTDDQLKSILKGRGIDFEGDLAAMKERLSQPAPAAAPTEAEKAEAEKTMQKRMLDLHIEDGGTAESFVALQQVAAMDQKTLSDAAIRKALKEDGFNDEEIAAVLKERYYMLNPDELQKEDEEDDESFNKRKEFLKKKVAFGSKKFENHSLHIKQKAEKSLKDLREAIIAQDEARRKEAEFSSKVDEISKAFSRELTLELGEIDSQKIDPVKYSVTESMIAEVTSELKDPAKRQQLFFTADNKLDVSKVFNLMLRNKSLESAVKTSFIEGSNRRIAEFQKVFPSSPQALGVGGTQRTTQAAGKIARAGKPEIVPHNTK